MALIHLLNVPLLFAVQPAKADNLDFRNRHGYLSLNVMIVSGATGLIFNVNADFPGANADSPIFRASSCYRVLRYEYSPFKNAIILGDKAYQRSLPFLGEFCKYIKYKIIKIKID